MQVGDQFRTNPLSHKPGGSTVRVIRRNGEVRDYDKVKYPDAFIRKILETDTDVVEAKVINTKEK